MIISVYAPAHGTGTTTVAANLAYLLSQSANTILVDISSSDINTSILAQFYMQHKATEEQIATVDNLDGKLLKYNNLTLLPCCFYLRSVHEFHDYALLIEKLANDYEYIIIDAGLREIEESIKKVLVVKPDYKCISAPQRSADVLVINKDPSAAYHTRDILRKYNMTHIEINLTSALKQSAKKQKLPVEIDKNIEKKFNKLINCLNKEELKQTQITNKQKKKGFLSKFNINFPVIPKTKLKEKQNINHKTITSPAPTNKTLKTKTVLLVGTRATALAPKMAELGWKTVSDLHIPSDVAVVDVERLPDISSRLHCPVVGLGTGRISEWFSDVLIASNNTVAIDLVSEYLNATSKKIEQDNSVSLLCKQKPGEKGFVFAFYSSAQGFQGKTVLAINTAALLADQGYSVCIVDLDTDKAGLTILCGHSDDKPPVVDLTHCFKTTFNTSTCVDTSTCVVNGPAGVKLIPAPLEKPGWFPNPQQVNSFITKLAFEYDYVILDFGARIASPAIMAALKASDRIFLVSTPLRTVLSVIARFKNRELSEINSEKVTAVINRVGIRGGISPRDAANLLGFDNQYIEIPEDPALTKSEVAKNDKYYPPALKKKGIFKKKSLLGSVLLKLINKTKVCT